MNGAPPYALTRAPQGAMRVDRRSRIHRILGRGTSSWDAASLPDVLTRALQGAMRVDRRSRIHRILGRGASSRSGGVDER